MFHLGFLALLFSSPAFAQEPQAESFGDGAAQDEARLVPTVFEGFVLEPDGAPAEGAVVVSSVGGKAVTQHDGSFRLEVGAPFDAASVQLTAVSKGGRSLVASSSVSLTGAPARCESAPWC